MEINKNNSLILNLIKELSNVREFIILLIIAITFLSMTVLSPYFLSAGNLLAVLLGLSVEVIVATGMTILLVSGGFDLSVGSVVAFAGSVTAEALVMGIPVIFSIGIGLLVGVLVGLVNGFIVAKIGINPFITTLGTMMSVRGLLLVVTKAKNIYGLPDNFKIIGQGKIFGIQILIIIAIVIVAFGDVLLRKSRFFRQNYYIGGNEKAANLSGINVVKVKMFNYILSGFLAALAGILMTSRLDSASVTAGTNLEFKVLTAVIIGGASLKGGEGSVLGAFLGSLLMALITNALTLLGVEVYWNQVVVGAALLIAVILDYLNQNRKNRISFK